MSTSRGRTLLRFLEDLVPRVHRDLPPATTQAMAERLARRLQAGEASRGDLDLMRGWLAEARTWGRTWPRRVSAVEAIVDELYPRGPSLDLREYERRFQEMEGPAHAEAERWLWLLDRLPVEDVFSFYLLPDEGCPQGERPPPGEPRPGQRT